MLPSKNHSSALAYVLAITALCVQSASAQTKAEVRTWFEKEWKAAENPFASLDLDTYELRFNIVNHSIGNLTAQRARELREAIKGKPDHPMRGPLAQYDARIARGGPPVASYRVWSENGLWRFTCDSEPRIQIGGDRKYKADLIRFIGGDEHVDMAFDGTRMWRVSDKQAVVSRFRGVTTATAEQRRGAPNEVYVQGNSAIKLHYDSNKQLFQTLLHGTMGVVPWSDVSITNLHIDGDSWSLNAHYDSGCVQQFQGIWIPDHRAERARGVIQSSRVLTGINEVPAEAIFPRLPKFTDWHETDAKIWIPQSVVLHATIKKSTDDDKEIAVFQEYTKVRIVNRNDVLTIKDLVRVPAQHTQDPIRGAWSITSDVRVDKNRATSFDSTGNVTAVQRIGESSAAVRAGPIILVVVVGMVIGMLVLLKNESIRCRMADTRMFERLRR